MYNVTIDGIAVEVQEGATILEAADAAGVKIPTLCHLRGAQAISSCRVCSVEVQGVDSLASACSVRVREGMLVTTNSPRVRSYRQIALELIVADLAPGVLRHMDDDKPLKRLCAMYGVEQGGEEIALSDADVEVQVHNPFLTFDAHACIRCQRCVAACNDLVHNHTLRTGKRGVRTIIDAPFGEGWRSVKCESCGTCAQACTTGALSVHRAPATVVKDVRHVLTTCPHCAIGCQLNLVVADGKIVEAEAADGPSNQGRLCVKGRFASFDFVDAPGRLRTPLIKNHGTGEFEPATWDEALSLVTRRFTELIDAHGGSSLAAFACSRSTNEDIYLFQKMARTALQTNNVDNCARV